MKFAQHYYVSNLIEQIVGDKLQLVFIQPSQGCMAAASSLRVSKRSSEVS